MLNYKVVPIIESLKRKVHRNNSTFLLRERATTCMVSQPSYEECRLRLLRCDKRSSDPQVAPILPHEGLDECHDVIEEDSASSNKPHRMGIEDKSRHKQDRDID